MFGFLAGATAVIGMILAPSILFLGMMRGLRRMQNGTLVSATEQRAGIDAQEVTWGDAMHSIFGGNSISIVPDRNTTPMTQRMPGVCPTCNTQNVETATYCKSCTDKI